MDINSGNGEIRVLRYESFLRKPGTGGGGPSVVIAGGAGFVGSHLCDRLLAEGCDVLCLDNLLTSSGENISHLRSAPGFTFVPYDITHPIAVQGPVDYVLDLASPASPEDYLRFPLQTMAVGSSGTRNLLELAKAKRATFLLASTSEIYGDPEIHPQPETYWGNVNSVGPRSVYDEAKRFSEALTMAYHRAHQVRVRISRIFNTYGPRMRIDDGRVLPNFMSQALRGEPLTVYGDGSQTRSLCYVSDLVDGLYRLLTVQSEEPLIVNLGNPDEVTVRVLAQEVLEVTGSKSQIVYRPLPQDDPRVRKPDIRHAREVLGWSPTISRQEGLKRVLPHFQRAVQQQYEPVQSNAA